MGDHTRAQRVRKMFDGIAARYDRRNTLFSLDRDRAWRRRAAERAGLRPGDLALDLCTGTGKLAHELRAVVGPGGRVIGIDFSEGMLERARAQEPAVEFRLGDVTTLPFPDVSVDAVCIGFGLRNLVDRQAAVREMFRVLRPGGRLVVLEFVPPQRSLLLALYRVYLVRLMPLMAGLLKRGENHAYRYLAESVLAFPSPIELKAQMEAIGFRPVTVERMTFGVAALHVGTRPA